MSFPNYPNKYNLEALFNPEDLIQSKNIDVSKFSETKGLIMFYDHRLYEYVKKIALERVELSVLLKPYLLSDNVLAMGYFGIGAPAAVVVLEEFAAMGVKNFISIGSSGSLQNKIGTGSIVLCSKAIRDEGTSMHYAPKSKFAYPSKELNDEIARYLRANNVKYSYGPTWTIDAPYRETNKEVQEYSKEGIITVEMEASALFIVGKVRGVNVSSIFTISDLLRKNQWSPQFHAIDYQDTMKKIFNIAHQILINY